MAKLIYYAPSGAEIKDLDISDLLRSVRKDGASYWNIGSGGGLLSYGPVERGRTMQIYFVPRKGFHLIYKDGKNAPVAAIPAKSPDKPGFAEIYIGGERERISIDQLVGRDEAEKILQHFAEHGTALPEQGWSPAR